MNDCRRDTGIQAYRSRIMLLLFIMAFAPAAAADTMFRANPSHTGVSDAGGIVTTNTELWRLATKGGVWSSPAVSNGVVYVAGGDDNLYAIYAVTGTVKWQFAIARYVFSSPAVSNGFVYIGSEDKNLYAIDAATGLEKWRFATKGHVGSSPAVSNGFVYFGSGDTNLYAVNAETGTEKWRFATGGPVESSPVVSNGVVYIGSDDKNLYAIDAWTGKEKWRFATGNPVLSTKMLTPAPLSEVPVYGTGVCSSPAVSDGIVYVGSWDNNLYAIYAATGMEKWRFATQGWVRSSPAVSGGIIYVGSGDTNLYAVDAETGKEKWRFATGKWVESSPAVANGVVYIGGMDKNLYAIDAVTGTEKWRFMTGGEVWSSPAVSNGIVYVGSWDEYLYAIGQVSPNPVPSTAGIQSTPSSESPSDSGDSLLTLPIIALLAMVFLGGGGFAVFRMKRPATQDQPADRKAVPERSPHPSRDGSSHANNAPVARPDSRSPAIPPDTTHHDVFISYSSRDKPVADAICNHLESRSIRCWVAPRDILPGMNFQESIIDAIDASPIMVLVFSAHANKSPHVLTEVNEAMSNGAIIIPFRIEDILPSKAMKYLISVPHWLDAMTPPLEQHIQELEETIRILVDNERRKQKGQ